MQENAKEILLNDYKRLGGCAEIYRTLLGCGDLAAIADVYTVHPTWCLENNFPTIEQLRQYGSTFSDKGVFVDKIFDRDVINTQVAIFHNCKGRISVEMDYDNAVIPMLYFANNCEVHIECNQHNTPAIRVPIHIYGNNIVTINGKGNAIFKRYEYDIK